MAPAMASGGRREALRISMTPTEYVARIKMGEGRTGGDEHGYLRATQPSTPRHLGVARVAA